MKLNRPAPDECARYYDDYIDLVPNADLIATLEEQIDSTVAELSSFSDEQAQWRPAPGEWNVIEIIGHVSDVERSFAYRALCFARNDPTPLPGVDQDVFMREAGFANRPLADVLEEIGDGAARVDHAPSELRRRGLGSARHGGWEDHQRAGAGLHHRRTRHASRARLPAPPSPWGTDA